MSQLAGHGSVGPAEKEADEMEKLVQEYLKQEQQETSRRPRLRKGIILMVLVLAGTLSALAAGIYYRVKLPDRRFEDLAAWRWFFFFAFLVPLYYLPNYVILVLIALVESKLLNAGPHVIYYIMGVRTPTIRLSRVVSWMILFMLVFRHSRLNHDYHHVYMMLLKTWSCVCLFFGANVLAALLAKAMSRQFHSRAHFQRMQDAVRKEYFLLALSRPQQTTVTQILANEVQALVSDELERMDKMADMRRFSTGRMDLSPSIRQSLDLAVLQPRQVARPTSTPPRSQLASPLASYNPGAKELLSRPSQKPNFQSHASGFKEQASEAYSHTQPLSADGSTHGGQAIKDPNRADPVKGVVNLVTDLNRRIKDLHQLKGVKGISKKKQSSTQKAEKMSREVLQNCLYRLERHIRKNKLQLTLTQQLGEADAIDEITNKAEARKMALFLYWHILPPSLHYNRTYIVESDLQPFLPSHEANAAFAVLDQNNDGRVTMMEMQEAVLKVYQERKYLANALKDTKSVVGKLQLICKFIFHTIFFFSYLMVFQVNVKELWISISSVTLAFVFVFGNSIRNIYEAVIFLFVVHAFDVGDWLLLNGDPHKVEEIALMTTTFVRGDGRRIYHPNIKLINEPIINVTRSENLWDKVTVLVDIDVTGEVMSTLDCKLKAFVGENPTEFTGAVGAILTSLENPMKASLLIYWEYPHNAEDMGRRSRNRTKMVLTVAKVLKEAGFSYTIPPQATSPAHQSCTLAGIAQNGNFQAVLQTSGLQKV